VKGRLSMQVGPEDGAKPQHYLVKVLRSKMLYDAATGKQTGTECSTCCLFHDNAKVCDIFSFPYHRSARFKNIWREGQAAGVIRLSPAAEWNGRSNRLPRNRCDEAGKSIVSPAQRHLRSGVLGGPK
jgi:hypothetical protein